MAARHCGSIDGSEKAGPQTCSSRTMMLWTWGAEAEGVTMRYGGVVVEDHVEGRGGKCRAPEAA